MFTLKLGNNTFFPHYNAKNLLTYAIPFKDYESFQSAGEAMERMSQLVFNELNGGRQLTFVGQGKYWDAKITERYYEHWWVDENNRMYYDCWSNIRPELRFKGKTKEDGNLIVKLTSSSVGSVNTMEISAAELTQAIKFGSSEGNGAMLRAGNVCKVEVDFNGEKETIELTAVGR